MAEDMDLTWRFLMKGLKVRFAPKALCYPVDPSTYQLYRAQVERWYRSFLQNISLHKWALLKNKRLAFFIGWYLISGLISPIFMVLLAFFLFKNPSAIALLAIITAYMISTEFLMVSAISLIKAWRLGKFWLAVNHTIENHDVVEWSSGGNVSANKPRDRKRIFTERYDAGKTYRSFDHKGWHFIILDSIGQAKDTPDYIGYVDEEQLDWLKSDLARTGTQTPIVLVTHIPFLSTSDQNLVGIDKPVPPFGLVTNYLTLRKLLTSYNVQLILSGHGHVRERIEVMGSTHVQSGAVSGRWWKGRLFGEPEGFSEVICKRDSFDLEYQDFGWTARKV